MSLAEQQGPSSQVDEQSWFPLTPHALVQAGAVPAQQAEPESHTVSQSSSRPLHGSVVANVHGCHVQLAEQFRVPMQVPTVHGPVEPCGHSKPSSVVPSQSSSTALHVSVLGVPGRQSSTPAVQVEEAVQAPIPQG
jgi:hypothetical protein